MRMLKPNASICWSETESPQTRAHLAGLWFKDGMETLLHRNPFAGLLGATLPNLAAADSKSLFQLRAQQYAKHEHERSSFHSRFRKAFRCLNSRISPPKHGRSPATVYSDTSDAGRAVCARRCRSASEPAMPAMHTTHCDDHASHSIMHCPVISFNTSPTGGRCGTDVGIVGHGMPIMWRGSVCSRATHST